MSDGGSEILGLERIVDGIGINDGESRKQIMSELGVDKWEAVSSMVKTDGEKVLAVVSRAGVSREATNMWRIREAKELRENTLVKKYDEIDGAVGQLVNGIGSLPLDLGILILKELNAPKWKIKGGPEERYRRGVLIVSEFCAKVKELISSNELLEQSSIMSIYTFVNKLIEKEVGNESTEIGMQIAEFDRYLEKRLMIKEA